MHYGNGIKMVARLQKENQELKDLNKILRQELDSLKRRLFGRKSEKFSFDHPELFDTAKLEEAQAPKGPESPKPEKPAKNKKPRLIRAARLPADLPVVVEEIIPDFVKANPEQWRRAGEERSEQLKKQPGYLYILETVRPKFVSIDNPFLPPVVKPAKPTLIDSGFWGSCLISEIICNRHLDHLPYYRQHKRYLRRYGVDLSQRTMSDMAGKVAAQLNILVERQKHHMLLGGYIRADETFITYLDRSNPKGSSRGYFWVYRGEDDDVIFDWQTSREYKHLYAWMGTDYAGILQCDGYGAYRSYRTEQGGIGREIKIAACLAHIRRKFEDAKDERPEVVRWILRIIAELYGVEKSLRLCYRELEESMREQVDYPALRVRLRQAHSRRLIDLLEKAFKRLLVSNILPKSGLGKALQYALAMWPDMQAYLNDGRVEIDNNLVENDIRPSAVGKKNWLFMGSPEAGDRAGVLYGLLISARNHGVDPQAYLKDVIERLPLLKSHEIDPLLPGNWAKANRDKHPLTVPAPEAA